MASRFDRRQELGLTPVWRVRSASIGSPPIARVAADVGAGRVPLAAAPAYTAAMAPPAIEPSNADGLAADRLAEDGDDGAVAAIGATAGLVPPLREPAPAFDRRPPANAGHDERIDRGDDAGPARSARIAALGWADF